MNASLIVLMCVAATAAAAEPELGQRLAELGKSCAPYLRSLPMPLPARDRTVLPAAWKFTFEAKVSPKQPGLPPAPAWQGTDFDDASWESTSVPEWRYRTQDGDSALEPNKLDSWRKIAAPADTICWYRTTFRGGPPAPGKRQWLCFEGVDWEAQVYLNGEALGSHRVYFEPFRFEVTGKLKAINTLAVRVIAGPAYGEPVAYWGMFPDIRAAQQRYTPNRASSIPGNLPIGYHSGCGFGIFREVAIEQTGPTRVKAVLARNDLSNGNARVRVELDRGDPQPVELSVEILPENCAGRSYATTVRCDKDACLVEIPMPEARAWSPDTPNLYRCRVTVRGSDARDVVFGCRSFELSAGRKDVLDGSFLLNGKPTFLRGTNIQGLNLYAYWGQQDELRDALLLLKAGHFNAVRSCQHVEFPEVRELLDRFGILSEQDMGGGRVINVLSAEQYLQTATALARETYNHPGVVLLSFVNECEYATEPLVRAALAVDPQRIFKPISGRFTASKKPWDLSADLRGHAVDDGHPYTGWYGEITAQSWNNLILYQSGSSVNLGPGYGTVTLPDRPVTLGEFGAEALDSYATMRDHYPPQFKPPAPDADSLWASSQVAKHDIKQLVGLGRDPRNLAEYIEASQNYQEAVVADQTIGMRLSPQAIAGYFQFHFIDVVPAFWPKSIVSHDHQPKKAYYQLAQINQPLVALPQLTGAKPDAMTLWVANDLPDPVPGCVLEWTVAVDGHTVMQGSTTLDVPASNSVKGPVIDLCAITATATAFDLTLTLKSAAGHPLSCYHRQVRCVPASMLKSTDQQADPFNPGKKTNP